VYTSLSTKAPGEKKTSAVPWRHRVRPTSGTEPPNQDGSHDRRGRSRRGPLHIGNPFTSTSEAYDRGSNGKNLGYFGAGSPTSGPNDMGMPVSTLQVPMRFPTSSGYS